MDLPPAIGGGFEAPDGEGIDEFVGEDHGAAFAEGEGGFEVGVMVNAISEECFLPFGERCGGFHEVHSGAETAEQGKVFQDGSGEESFAGADFDEVAARGFPECEIGPAGDGPRGKVGEHGGGGEIAAPADGLDSACVVAALRIVQG